MSTGTRLDQSLGYNLKRVQHRLHRQMADALRPCGLTTAQYAVLSALLARPDQTNADLANAAFITPQSMQAVLSRLEAAGHVVRHRDETHGRRQLARVTASGEALAQKGKRAVDRIEAKLARSVHPLSGSEARELLRRMQRALE